jgi:osmoprotectant transport system substrate-binding protein
MSTTTTGARRLRRLSLVGAAAAAALLLAACSGGGSSSAPPPPSAAPGGAASDQVPPDAVSVTAMTGQVQLPPGKPGVGKPVVIIGDKNFPEEYVLGQLYAQALQAKGYTVQLKPNIGGSELIDTAFASNQINMYPEYLGEIVTSVAKQPAPTSASATYNAAKQFEESQRQGTLTLQTPFQDVDTVVVPAAYAQQHQLAAVPDLNKVGPGGQGVTLAGQIEFKTRQTGLVGMQQQYGLTNVAFLSTPAGSQYQALDQNAAQAADAFSTDYQLLSGKYTALTDPKGIFGFQYVAPVVKQATVQAEGPEFTQTLNWVSSLLSTKAIQALNQQVQGNGADPAAVSAQFLNANGVNK